ADVGQAHGLVDPLYLEGGSPLEKGREMLDVERWFVGKALERAQAALVLLVASQAEGAWRPGASRTVRAAFAKSKRARLLAEEHGAALELLGERAGDPISLGWSVQHAMAYGLLERLPGFDFDVLARGAEGEAALASLAAAREWRSAFLP